MAVWLGRRAEALGRGRERRRRRRHRHRRGRGRGSTADMRARTRPAEQLLSTPRPRPHPLNPYFPQFSWRSSFFLPFPSCFLGTPSASVPSTAGARLVIPQPCSQSNRARPRRAAKTSTSEPSAALLYSSSDTLRVRACVASAPSSEPTLCPPASTSVDARPDPRPPLAFCQPSLLAPTTPPTPPLQLRNLTMSYYPGQQYHNQNSYGVPPPQQGYGAPPPQGYPPPGNYGPPPPQQYGGYPPPSPQPPYNGGYGQPTPPPQQYGGYHQTPPPQQYGAPPPGPPPQHAQQYPRPGMMPTVNSNQWTHGNHSAPPPPPTAPQNFGHGAPGSYSFQYSACTGRRKALLIGINYFGQRGQLRGCINDVKNMSTYLNEYFGYKREDMVCLTDDQQNPMSQPTKANILRAMHWLVKDARPNDSLFFHYSGHGGQTKDLDGDEDDGYDEVVYPVDFRNAGHIVDDEMHRIMVQSLQPGVRLTAIFDSCHSGSALDLPYIYSTQGVLKEPNLAKEAGQGLLGIVSAYAKNDIGGMLSTASGMFKKVTRGSDVYEKNLRTKTSPADVIMWSGSKDTQTSADASIQGEATGAMSWAFITSLKKNPNQSYVQLLNSIRDELEGKYSQKPQLSCSHPLNVDLLYVM